MHKDKTTTNNLPEYRFAFGENWQRFLTNLTEAQIIKAEISLKESLGLENLHGKSFLDIGSGSGLFSLAARRLGASVYSFDYDNQSVACTNELKKRFFLGDESWTVSQGSVLDEEFLQTLGHFDIVYSWGVLHHTGSMWQAIENTVSRLKPHGLIFIALYNDQGRKSRNWKRVKFLYNFLPAPLRFIVLWPAFLVLWGENFIVDLLKGQPFRNWKIYGQERGMTPWRDVVDWVGGYPFEVAQPDVVFHFFRRKGFAMQNFIFRNSHGCNEFIFERK